MKKKAKGIMCVSMTLATLVTYGAQNYLNANAGDLSLSNLANNKDMKGCSKKEVLRNLGFTDNIIDILSEDEINNVIDKYNSDAEIAVENTYSEYDSLGELEECLSASKDDLIKKGLSEEEINKIMTIKDDCINMSTEELLQKYGGNKQTIKMQKKLVDKYLNKSSDTENNKPKDVRTAGTLSSSKMTFSFITYDYGKITGKPDIDTEIYFRWNGNPSYSYSDLFDKVTLEWNTPLMANNVSSFAAYWDPFYSRKYTWSGYDLWDVVDLDSSDNADAVSSANFNNCLVWTGRYSTGMYNSKEKVTTNAYVYYGKMKAHLYNTGALTGNKFSLKATYHHTYNAISSDKWSFSFGASVNIINPSVDVGFSLGWNWSLKQYSDRAALEKSAYY